MTYQTDHMIRPAGPADADYLVQLADIAGEGLASHVWSRDCAENEDAWSVGRKRALRREGAFSYRNALMIDKLAGDCAGCLIGYPIKEGVDLETLELPDMFRPLQELENLAVGSWYVNVLAVYERYRGRGYGEALLTMAERKATRCGTSTLSIIVSDANEGARRLYERFGFREVARRQIVKEDWSNKGENWVLMIKSLDLPEQAKAA